VTIASGAFVVAGRYQVGDVLGRGGMGEVRRARDLRLNRDVAIKFLRADLAAQPEARHRFEHEAHNAARLNHPNVVEVFDAGEHEGQPYLVMECLPGKTLRDELRDGPLSQARATWIGRDVLAGMAAAHSLGIIHRDVTPANILMTDTGRAKLADFGIAKAAEAESVTTVGQVIGTPAYIAPERLRGEEATAASDMYGLGATLNAAVGARGADLDPGFNALIDRMMDPDPERRPSAEFALAAFDGTGEVEAETTTIPAVVAPVQPTELAAVIRRPRTRSRSDNLLRAATVGIAVLIGALLLFASSTGGDGSPVVSEETTPSTVTAPPQTTVAPPAPTVGARVEVFENSDEPKGKAKGREKGDDDD
jgi:hypothetical protein